jgi:hypothetical protein
VNFPYAFLSFWFWIWKGSVRPGKFTTGEISVRALELSQLWVARWGAFEPIGHRLRDEFPHRWARFHWAAMSNKHRWLAAERARVLARHYLILNELRRISGQTNFLVLAEDWGSNEAHAGWVSRTLRDAWPWRISVNSNEPHSPPAYIWVSPELTSLEDLNAVLVSASRDEAMALITDEGLNWLYWPHIGGADVVAPSTDWRDILRATLEE